MNTREVLRSSRLPDPKKGWSYTEVAIILSNFCQPKRFIVYCQLCSNVCITAQTKLLSVGQHCETNPNSLWNLPGEIFHPLLRINYTRKNNAEQWLNVTRTYPKWKSGDSLFCPYNENQTTLICTPLTFTVQTKQWLHQQTQNISGPWIEWWVLFFYKLSLKRYILPKRRYFKQCMITKPLTV